MNTNLTEIICIVDRSGSMESIRSDAIGGFNAFLEGQKAEPGEARLTLVLFDDRYEVPVAGAPLASVEPLTTKTFVPRGSTALLDAVGRTIDEVGKHLAATPEHERPGQVIVAILTDGLENSSRKYTWQMVGDRIRHQRDKYNWEFVFLAANQDAIATASQLSIDPADAVDFDASGEGVQTAYASLDAMVRERRARRR